MILWEPILNSACYSKELLGRLTDWFVRTMSIHYTGNFLPWHRWYVAAYETALREECQYAGAQP